MIVFERFGPRDVRVASPETVLRGDRSVTWPDTAGHSVRSAVNTRGETADGQTRLRRIRSRRRDATS